ncbi:Lipid A palmitoyltransferase PagP, partial [Bienertia sinuspersici]
MWKKSPSGLVEPQKSEEIVSQQSLKVEKRQEKAAELSNLPPMAPKNSQSSKATNSLRRNGSSSSPYPVQINQEVASQQSLRVEDEPEFDDTVDVVTIDAVGNHSLVSGSIQVLDIWNNNVVRYYVQFNEFHQPIRKVGQLLVKLIGSIAKQERFCPVGELDWHHIDEVLLADMINEIREDAKAKTDILAETDGSNSQKEVENEVFESLMYGGEPPKRPWGFGFGVVKRNIYGVHGLLRKEGHGKVHERPLDNENVKLTMSENAELVKRNEVLEEILNQNTMLLMSLLEEMRNGKPSTELIDAAQTQ